MFVNHCSFCAVDLMKPIKFTALTKFAMPLEPALELDFDVTSERCPRCGSGMYSNGSELRCEQYGRDRARLTEPRCYYRVQDKSDDLATPSKWGNDATRILDT